MKEATPSVILNIRKNKKANDDDIALIFKHANASLMQYPVDIWAIAKSLGFEVREATFENGAISGIMYDKSKAPKIARSAGMDSKRAIVLNRDESRQAQAFTIAHELGHFALHVDKEQDFFEAYHTTKDKEVQDLTDEERRNKVLEDEADSFGARLLMPEKLFVDLVNASPVREDKEKLTQRLSLAFMINEEPIRKRFEDLKIRFEEIRKPKQHLPQDLAINEESTRRIINALKLRSKEVKK